MSRFKSFLLGAVKIAAAILIVIASIIVLGWGVVTVQEHRNAAANAQLAQPRQWPSIRVERLGNAQLKLSTMWREGQLFYQFSGDMPNAPIVTLYKDFTLIFQDVNNFKVFETAIPPDELTWKPRWTPQRGSSKDDDYVFNANSSVSLDAATYQRFANWDVTGKDDGTIRPMTEEVLKQIDAVQSQQKQHAADLASGDLVESTIDGRFGGWEGDTIFTLTNGQVWQRVVVRQGLTLGGVYFPSPGESYLAFASSPKVTIIKSSDGNSRMQVEGVPATVIVRRLK
jgi:hypothetical protein